MQASFNGQYKLMISVKKGPFVIFTDHRVDSTTWIWKLPNVQQPTVSRQIKHMEKKVGLEFFLPWCGLCEEFGEKGCHYFHLRQSSPLCDHVQAAARLFVQWYKTTDKNLLMVRKSIGLWAVFGLGGMKSTWKITDLCQNDKLVSFSGSLYRVLYK